MNLSFTAPLSSLSRLVGNTPPSNQTGQAAANPAPGATTPDPTQAAREVGADAPGAGPVAVEDKAGPTSSVSNIRNTSIATTDPVAVRNVNVAIDESEAAARRAAEAAQATFSREQVIASVASLADADRAVAPPAEMVDAAYEDGKAAGENPHDPEVTVAA